jgi:hypothetical protein
MIPMGGDLGSAAKKSTSEGVPSRQTVFNVGVTSVEDLTPGSFTLLVNALRYVPLQIQTHVHVVSS